MNDPNRRLASIVRSVGVFLLAVGLAGCGAVGGGSPAPSGAALAHPTGATDLILRYEQGGGFVAPGFLATEAPAFSLYGDGTAIFRNPADAGPLPDSSASPIIRGVPFEVARLSEAQVQVLLAFALETSGLRAAADHYDRPIADAPTTVFTIDAGGVKKAVSINGLGIDLASGQDAAILARLTGLATRLIDYGSEVADEQMWNPDRYRGILTDEASGTPIPWPWPAILPTDFVLRAAPNAPPFPIRTMAPSEVARLGLAGVEGGLQGVSVQAPTGGQTYSFRLRPLLPDEAF